MRRLTTLSAVALTLSVCSASPEIYGEDSMSSEALSISREVVGACTAFSSGAREYWDDVLRKVVSEVEVLSADDRNRVYTAIASGCSLDASYGLEYQRLIWNDRSALRDHLSQLVGDDGDASLTQNQRKQFEYVIGIAGLTSPPD